MRPSVFKALDEYNRKQADFAAWCKRRQIATDDWITLSGRDANGDKHGGARVLLDDDGAIVYGLGGGHTGKKLGEALNSLKSNRRHEKFNKWFHQSLNLNYELHSREKERNALNGKMRGDKKHEPLLKEYLSKTAEKEDVDRLKRALKEIEDRKRRHEQLTSEIKTWKARVKEHQKNAPPKW